MCDLLWVIWTICNDFIFNGRSFASFMQSFGYTLDPYVILSLAGGAVPRHGYWMQPFDDGSMRFLQLV
jgi:hypothetical protein